MARDPVCGMGVEESEEAIMHEIDGMKYYFCSNSCLHEFLAPDKEIREMQKRIMIGIALLIPIVILTYIEVIPKPINAYLLFLLTTPLQLWIGWRFYEGMIDAIKHKIINMYVLIVIGTTTAWLYSSIVTFLPNLFPFQDTYFETSAAIIVALLIGSYLEEKSRARATNTIRKLLDLKPRTARIIKDGIEREISIEKVKVGDIIIVRNGEKMPVDGVVIEGYASIDQSPITGESIPVEKGVGDEVIGGTINRVGVIKFKATKVGKDTVLSHVIKVVEDARSSKVPIQRLADKISSYFVPIVVSIALASAILWHIFGSIEVPYAILILVTVLIIACPCALGIATPIALVVGTAKGAENGILIKDGAGLEVARKIDTIVFDKTGTITKGEPIVKEIIPLGEHSSKEILRLAAIAERWSEHPLGKAIVKKAKEEGIIIAEPDSFRSLIGFGIIANYANHTILIGNKRLMEEHGIVVNNLKYSNDKVILVAIDNRLSGIIVIGEEIKEGVEEVIKILRDEGIEPIMLTGDDEDRARVIANRLGIEKVIAEVLPHQKADVIKRLKEEGKIVAMVGDGINDAPALIASDLGIAIGSATDIAKESGSIILLKDDIRDIITALDISKKTVAKIKQNLFWAFAYNSALIPIAAGALIPIFGIEMYRFLPFLAAVAMGLSDATVVSNSLLLNKYKPRFKDDINIEVKKSIVSMKVVDPVCKMKIDAESAIKLEYGSKIYYFCREECKEEFLNEPKKYA